MQRSAMLTHPLVILLVAIGLIGVAATSGADVLKKPSKIRTLIAAAIAANQTKDLVQIGPTGVLLGAYSVPKNRVLVITTITIRPLVFGAGFVEVMLLRGVAGSNTSTIWKVPADRPTQFQVPTGIVISSGETLRIENRASSDSSVTVDITGYEAKNS